MSSSTPTNNISMHERRKELSMELKLMILSHHVSNQVSHLLDHAEKIVSEKGTLIGVRVHQDPQNPLTLNYNVWWDTRQCFLRALFETASSREDIPEVEFQMVSLFDTPPKRCLTFWNEDAAPSDSDTEGLAFGTVGMTWWDVVVFVGAEIKGEVKGSEIENRDHSLKESG
ncbi:hypothetical protein HYALB_00005392 [Hymenoscyphus albidus]|uniref:Uncharacterized protein n=1 Tax=Hymenoscyphus albidus TaxID=595503 RepID=A0A9N9LEI3_9HELO|nr:hypothetical protein HYALB_00005392 [Hymenoscyphus albidus]